MSLEDKVGMKFEPFTFEIEKGKIKEFALAIGDPNPLYETGEVLPPTFATVMDMWRGPDFFELTKRLELDITKVLHGEQEYEYLGKIKAGEKIKGMTTVTEVKRKSSMDIIKLETYYTNEANEIVLISRNTVIERH